MSTSIAATYADGWRMLPEFCLAAGVVGLLLWRALRPISKAQSVRAGFATLIGYLALAWVLGGGRQSLFSGMLVLDPLVDFSRGLFGLSALIGLYLVARSDEVEDLHAGEFVALFLALTLGMSLMAAASDLVMVYIAIELVSLMSYVLAGFRPHNQRSAEASLKYVIYGGAASGAMLFGFSILYGLTGQTQLSLLNEEIRALGVLSARAVLDGSAASTTVALTAGLGLTLTGFAYKVAAVPLHMWSPDVYQGAPTPFTAFLSTGPKAAGFALLLRFFLVGFAGNSEVENTALLQDVTQLPWMSLIVLISLLSMTWGNLAAIGQSNIKRFLAYSSIAHAGYALIGLAALSTSGAKSVLLYMFFYVLMNFGTFYAVIWMRDHAGTERIDAFTGLGRRAPFVAICLAICLLSLTGLPGFAGFAGKYYLFAAALERGASLELPALCQSLPATASLSASLGCRLSGGGMFYVLAVVGLVNSAVSLYYYARILKLMFLRDGPEEAGPLPVDPASKLILGPIAALLILFGLYWVPAERAAHRAIVDQAGIALHRPSPEELQVPDAPTRHAHQTAEEAAAVAQSAAR